MKINFSRKFDFLPSSCLLYIQKIGSYKEDALFQILSSDFKLAKPFDYQMAFFKNNEIYHCFLAPISKLKKSRFCFPEPLIFQALFDERLIEERDYCILNLYDKTLYLCFYQEGKFNNLKKIENFNPNNMDSFFKQNRFIELLKHYESKVLLYSDLDIIKPYFSSQIKCLNLNDILHKNSLLKLSSYSIKNLDKNCNFIKHNKIKISFWVKIILLFIFSLSLSMMVLLFKDFLEYKQNKELQNKNLILQKELNKLEDEKQELLAHLENLNQNLVKQNSTLLKQEELLNRLNKEVNKNKASMLYKILLELKGLKISALKLENSKFSLVFNEQADYENALNKLLTHFRLLKEDKTLYTLDLEFLDE
ncbi:hypothetical protein [Campylobacter sp. VTCC 70190]|uniref:hypothetical protein n=1 Tax=Campylobacter sp. VTCC 70190 TaxID=3392118 RepID=UPI00398EAEA4